MDPQIRAVINQIGLLETKFGTSITVTRVVQATTPVTNVFGTPTNATTSTITTNIIVDSQKIDMTATLAGGKAKEVLSMIVSSGVLKTSDEFVFDGRTFKVDGVHPVNFGTSKIVDMVTASGEVSDG